MSESRGPEAEVQWRKLAWAPAVAALVTGLVYFSRVDSLFYFLYGAEGQGILLASALAKGKGFVDLALPGNPAHVREPPLFYLWLAALIKTFGLRMLPMKLLMWAGYVATAAGSVLFFQRRARPWIALIATLLFALSFELFRFFTGPKSDVPFMALILFSLLLIEILMERIDRKANDSSDTRESSYKTFLLAAGAVVLSLSAVFTRSLGLALFIGGAGALLVYGRGRLSFIKRLKWIAVLVVPLALALSLWSARTASLENTAGYDYADWFLMDLAPDSPEMIAVDFHAPLMQDLPRISAAGFMHRVGRHALMYPTRLFSMITGLDMPSTPEGSNIKALLVISLFAALFLLAVFGAYLAERKRPPLVPLFLASYFAAIVIWPMDDPRLLFPLFPFAAFYTVYGFYRAGLVLAGKAVEKKKAAFSCGMVTALLFLGVITAHCVRNLHYFSSISELPAERMRPGFRVRFLSAAHLNSYRLLDWLRKNAEKDAVIMYHSPPPCRLITGRTCSSIPFTSRPSEAREYIMESDIDYLVMDEFGKVFPAGPGQFVEKVMRPVWRKYQDDFVLRYSISGTDSRVVEVKNTRD